MEFLEQDQAAVSSVRTDTGVAVVRSSGHGEARVGELDKRQRFAQLYEEALVEVSAIGTVGLGAVYLLGTVR